MDSAGSRRFYLVVGFLWLPAAVGVFWLDDAGRWLALAWLVLAIVYFEIAMMCNPPAP
jgi:hypothetical protein